jgi:hypothetical protein
VIATSSRAKLSMAVKLIRSVQIVVVLGFRYFLLESKTEPVVESSIKCHSEGYFRCPWCFSFKVAPIFVLNLDLRYYPCSSQHQEID